MMKSNHFVLSPENMSRHKLNTYRMCNNSNLRQRKTFSDEKVGGIWELEAKVVEKGGEQGFEKRIMRQKPYI